MPLLYNVNACSCQVFDSTHLAVMIIRIIIKLIVMFITSNHGWYDSGRMTLSNINPPNGRKTMHTPIYVPHKTKLH